MNDCRDLVPIRGNALELQIEEILIGDLKPRARNPRIHSEKQIKMLARNIDNNGFLVPCLIDEQNGLLTGTARVLAAERLGMKSVPVIRVSHFSDSEKRAFVLADNKLAECGHWDIKLLRSELQFLSTIPDFDFLSIGFETADLDIILETSDDDSDDIIPVISAEAVSRSGDLWQAGSHRIYCGDALSPESYDKLLAGKRARLVFTDPPYNVAIGDVGGKGSVQHREFAMAYGEMSRDKYTSFLGQITRNVAIHSLEGSLHYYCIDWRHCLEMLTAGNASYLDLRNICVWRKTNAGMGSLYRSQHEFVFVFKNGTAPHVNNINLGAHGRNRSNVWDYGGVNSFGKHRDELLAMHPTVKPVALIADIIRDASARGDLVLDAFGGSGSTLIAAEKTGRRAALIEIDPLYVDCTIRRWQAFTGKQAVRAETGATFAERETAVHERDAVKRIGDPKGNNS